MRTGPALSQPVRSKEVGSNPDSWGVGGGGEGRALIRELFRTHLALTASLGGGAMVLALGMRKLRPREVNQLASEYTAMAKRSRANQV